MEVFQRNVIKISYSMNDRRYFCDWNEVYKKKEKEESKKLCEN